MINVHLASLIINFITFLFVYIVSITMAGFFGAMITKAMGDPTAEEEGFLTLDPLEHVDLVGTIVLLFFNFGWGKYVPVDARRIHGKGAWRTVKICTAFFATSLCYFLIALTNLLLLIGLFGENILQLVKYMLLYEDVSHLYIAQLYPGQSSLTISCAYILFAFVFLNLGLSILNFILNGYRLSIFLWQDSSDTTPDWLYNQYLLLLIHFILLILFVGVLKVFWVNIILYLGYYIGYFLH